MWRLPSQLSCQWPWNWQAGLLTPFSSLSLIDCQVSIGWSQSQRSRKLVDMVQTHEPGSAQRRVGECLGACTTILCPHPGQVCLQTRGQSVNGLLQICTEIKDLHQNVTQLWHFVHSTVFSMKESVCLFTFWCNSFCHHVMDSPLSSTDQICQLYRWQTA